MVFFNGAKMDFLIRILEAVLSFLRARTGSAPEPEIPLPDLRTPHEQKYEPPHTIRSGTLIDVFGCSLARAELFVPHINKALLAYDINTPLRIAHFLAQIGHESGGIKYTRELWGPTPQQLRYERDFHAPWPVSPEEAKLPGFSKNRLAFTLGNDASGDGSRYRGRGLIQNTGKTNYQLAGKALGQDFVSFPDLLEQPPWAAMAAAEFWKRRGCNELADADDFEAVTRRVNGGTNGIDDRKKLLEKARRVLGC